MGGSWRKAAAVGLLALAVAGDAAAAEALRIGALFARTGGLESLAVPALHGVELRAAEANAAGGVLGRPVEIVVRDTASSPDGARAATRELLDQGVAALVGFVDADPAMAGGRLAQEAGVPLMVAGATSPRLPGAIGDNLFLACFGDNAQAAAGVDYLVGTLGARRVFVLAARGHEYTDLLSAYATQALKDRGATVAGTGQYELGKVAATVPLDAIRSAQVDAVYVAGMAEGSAELVRALRQGGIVQPLMAGDGFDTPLLLDAGSAADGVAFTTHALLDPPADAAAARFADAYEAKFGKAPENAFAALGYDALGLVLDAITRAGSAEPAAIRQALAATHGFAGVTGTIGYADGRRLPDKPVAVVVIRDGKPTLAAAITPTSVPAP
ncbi:MAG: ABC transporter substrate-binding protein [Geminicoccaceae bacterium]